MTKLHPGRAFLARASARFTLVEAGEMSIDEAIAGLVKPARALFPLYCQCERDIVARWEAADRNHLPVRRRPAYRKAAA